MLSRSHSVATRYRYIGGTGIRIRRRNIYIFQVVLILVQANAQVLDLSDIVRRKKRNDHPGGVGVGVCLVIRQPTSFGRSVEKNTIGRSRSGGLQFGLLNKDNMDVVANPKL